MAAASDRVAVLRSIVTKNVGLFLVILVVAIVPLAARYYMDSRDYEIQNLASQLEFFASRGAMWLDVDAVERLQRPADRHTVAYRSVLTTLRRIERDFDVDNAVLMRRAADGHYMYLAAGHDGFDPGSPAEIHDLFPETYKATNDTWMAGEMMHSQLFGGRVGETDYNQFLQINIPLKRNDRVVAILMLNKFANPVAAAVRMKTMKVVALSVGLVVAGLILFGIVSLRMLRPLQALTSAAGQVAAGDLNVALPPPRSRDEVGRLSATFRGMLEGLRQRDFIRDTFGRYVTKEVVDELLGSPDGLRLGGEARVITILVTDLRGFTALATTLAPQAMLEILNRYLERMVPIIRRHRGTIDEIQGDGILAFFGAPVPAHDDSVRAVACALEMQLALIDFNRAQRAAGRPELAMGIGVNTGEVIVGNIGSEQRTKYGAVGSAINMAYRIESHTIGGQVLIAPATYDRVRPLVRVRGTMTAEFKGLDRPLTLYDVAGLGGDYDLSLPEDVDTALVTVTPAIPVACFPIDGKVVSIDAIAGHLVGLATRTAALTVDVPIAPQSNVKIILDPNGRSTPAELYAKVLASPRESEGGVAPLARSDESEGMAAATGVIVVGFTSISAEAAARLDAVRKTVDGIGRV